LSLYYILYFNLNNYISKRDSVISKKSFKNYEISNKNRKALTII